VKGTIGTLAFALIGSVEADEVEKTHVDELFNRKVSRRTFLRYVAALGVGATLTGVAGNLIRRIDEDLYETRRTRYLMGTFVSVSVMSSNTEMADLAINSAFDEIVRLEGLMSRYKHDSQISRLNREGILEGASPEIIHVLRKARYYSDISGGAFDVTVKPILDLYINCFGAEGKPPTESEIEEALELVDYRNVAMNQKSVWFKKQGMGVTLDGIAKGYIVDRAASILKEHGVEHALINAGGDIKTIDGKEGGKAWRIAIRNPRGKGYIGIIEIDNGSVATSGDYEIYFDKDKRFHHIVNPKTGYSALDNASVTVLTKDVVDADALATTMFVLCPEEGMRLIERLGDVECLIVTRDGTALKSRGIFLKKK